ncbi:FkbM family methyltransferase [Burkholderia multivorans]|uniref:FkbM family methyltransferase n=1 Tax=Burkholderia multivorans TaxID=87883 RepID=UPI000278204B|nr:FkbM family methyltransferase [Burkholderia multivorans]EJO57204.1 methyltransferase, FkbM family [Burkholderia multivorans CF2]MBR7892722.1 FkbM family methyltransferase [Burkholderia multivorans]MBR8451493.1 FkbM family methyltransferase [Burkholderia multivorans]MBU9143732.1 FkbM family methyltransferase [Burkholderia multivorans]MBU9470939.1 FkbM family methyltransferase [Burkholderia multivorans]
MAEIGEIETRYGRLQVPNAKSDVVGRHLSRFGEWAWLESLFVSGFIPAVGARVLDGGAFLGTFGLGLSHIRELGYVHFVEANSDIIPLLVHNVDLNCRANWNVENVLLAPQGVAVGLPHAERDNIGSTSFVLVENESQPQHEIKTQTIREIEERVGKFDLVKLDLEGAEFQLLDVDRDYLSLRDMILWVECNETPQSFALAELFLSMGRKVYYFAFPAYNPDNVNRSAEPIFPWAYEAGLLAVKNEISGLGKELIEYGCILREISSDSDLKAALWRTPRWGLEEWLNLSLPEVVALAAHRLHGDDINKFPESDPKLRPLIDEQLRDAQNELTEATGRLKTMTQNLSDMTERYSKAREEGQACQHMLELANQRISDLEKNIAQSSAQALDRLARLGEVKRLSEERTQLLEQECALLRSQIDALRAIESSAYWRAGAPIRRMATRYPAIKSVLVIGLRALAKITRPFR